MHDHALADAGAFRVECLPDHQRPAMLAMRHHAPLPDAREPERKTRIPVPFDPAALPSRRGAAGGGHYTVADGACRRALKRSISRSITARSVMPAGWLRVGRQAMNGW